MQQAEAQIRSLESLLTNAVTRPAADLLIRAVSNRLGIPPAVQQALRNPAVLRTRQLREIVADAARVRAEGRTSPSPADAALEAFFRSVYDVRSAVVGYVQADIERGTPAAERRLLSRVNVALRGVSRMADSYRRMPRAFSALTSANERLVYDYDAARQASIRGNVRRAIEIAMREIPSVVPDARENATEGSLELQAVSRHRDLILRAIRQAGVDQGLPARLITQFDMMAPLQDYDRPPPDIVSARQVGNVADQVLDFWLYASQAQRRGDFPAGIDGMNSVLIAEPISTRLRELLDRNGVEGEFLVNYLVFTTQPDNASRRNHLGTYRLTTARDLGRQVIDSMLAGQQRLLSFFVEKEGSDPALSGTITAIHVTVFRIPPGALLGIARDPVERVRDMVGCRGDKHFVRDISIPSGASAMIGDVFVHNPVDQNGHEDCLIRAVHRAITAGHEMGMWQQSAPGDPKHSRGFRAKNGAPPTGRLDIARFLMPLARACNCNIDVYQMADAGYQLTKYLGADIGKKHTVRILSAGHHVFTLFDSPIHDHTCSKCGKVYKKVHTCNNKRKLFFQSIQSGLIDARTKKVVQQVADDLAEAKRELREKPYQPLEVQDITEGKRSAKQVVVWDAETFRNERGKHFAYLICAYNATTKEECVFWGRDCLVQFLFYLARIKSHTKLVSFNGSNFDMYLLMEAYIATAPFHEEIRNNLKPVSGSIIFNSGIEGCDFGKYIQHRDIYRMGANSSLAKIAKSFGLEICKGVFPHDFIKDWSDLEYMGPRPAAEFYPASHRDRLDETEVKEGELWVLRDVATDYCMQDCRVTYEIWEKMCGVMQAEMGADLPKFITAPGMTYGCWTNSKIYKAPEPHQIRQHRRDPLTYPDPWDISRLVTMDLGDLKVVRSKEMNDFFVAGTYGGRVNYFSRHFRSSQLDGFVSKEVAYQDIRDCMIDTDAVSLYVSAMTLKTACDIPIEFPSGEAHWTTSAENRDLQELLTRGDWSALDEEFIGFMQVHVVPNKSYIVSVLPKRSPRRGGCLWDNLDSHPDHPPVYTSKEIVLAMRHGYRFTLVRAIEFRGERLRPFDDYISKTFDMKDRASREGNTVLKHLAKLLGNSVYGKMLEKLRTGRTQWVSNLQEYMEFLQECEVTDYVKCGNQLLMTGECRDVELRIRKASYLGAFITSFSRMIIDEVIFNAGDPTRRDLSLAPGYGDTDSAFVRRQCAIKMKQMGHCGEGRGQVNNDIGGDIHTLSAESNGDNALIMELIVVGPKFYYCAYAKPDGSMGEHKRAKGLPADQLTREDFVRILHGEQVRTARDSIKRIRLAKPHEMRAGKKDFDLESVVVERVAGRNKPINRYDLPATEGTSNWTSVPWGHPLVPPGAETSYLELHYGRSPSNTDIIRSTSVH